MATKTNENVYAEIVLRSKTGASLVRDVSRFTAERIPLYLGSEESAAELQEKLKKAGFKIIAATQFGVSITGPEKLYNDFFKAKIVERPAAMFFGGGKEHVAPAFSWTLRQPFLMTFPIWRNTFIYPGAGTFSQVRVPCPLRTTTICAHRQTSAG